MIGDTQVRAPQYLHSLHILPGKFVPPCSIEWPNQPMPEHICHAIPGRPVMHSRTAPQAPVGCFFDGLGQQNDAMALWSFVATLVTTAVALAARAGRMGAHKLGGRVNGTKRCPPPPLPVSGRRATSWRSSVRGFGETYTHQPDKNVWVCSIHGACTLEVIVKEGVDDPNFKAQRILRAHSHRKGIECLGTLRAL